VVWLVVSYWYDQNFANVTIYDFKNMHLKYSQICVKQQPLGPQKVAVVQRRLLFRDTSFKTSIHLGWLGTRLVVVDSCYWSEVVVKIGLTIPNFFEMIRIDPNLHAVQFACRKGKRHNKIVYLKSLIGMHKRNFTR
jgi:hypothetical protein